MIVRELLGPPCALTPVTGQAGGLDRDVRWVVTTDLPDPSRYLQGGELIVTGMIWRKGPQDAERFVSAIAAAGASALAAGNAGDDELPADLLAACRKHRLPLLRVPGALAFATLTEYVVRRISGQRASDLGSVLERHQRLVAPGDPAQALGAILELIAADLGLPCWVIDSGGTAVASSGEDLDEPERAKLARTALAATTLPTRVVAPPTPTPTPTSASASASTPAPTPASALAPTSASALAPTSAQASASASAPALALASASALAPNGESASSSTRPRRTVFPITDEDRITDWYLVLDGDWRLWDPQRRAVVDQVTDVLKAERARLADRVTPWRADAERLLTEITAGTAGPDVACRLTDLGLAAGPGGYRAIAIAVSDPTAHPAEILEAAFAPYSALIAHFDADPTTGLPTHAVAVTPAAASGDGDPAIVLRDWLDRVTPGLATRRIGVGLSDHVTGVTTPALKRAVADARHALRVAITKPAPAPAPTPVTVVRQADIASHALLLASIPDEVRSTYRDRMLGPILDYDRAHNSELEVTLESFLRASSSWTKCASAMHIHVNTLRYRISRIEELVGRPLSLLETQADLLLALDLRES